MNEKILYLSSWLASTYINLFGNKKYPFQKILVIKLDEIGDMVTAMHVFYNLHKSYPDAQITLVCKKFNFIFFKYLTYITCTSEIPTTDVNFDLIVDLRGNSETIEYALKNKPKYRLDRGKIRIINKFFGGQKNEIDTNLEIILPIIKPEAILDNYLVTSSDEVDRISVFLRDQKIKRFVVLHLGARDASRRWPVDRFAACINYINEVYKIPCLLVGGQDDYTLGESCLQQINQQLNVNVSGKFNLLEFYELCRQAELFIGNESGPLHLAASAHTNAIALFGPGVKNVFYPKGDNVKIHHYFLAKNHTHQTIENSTIFKITVEEVKESIDLFLK